MSTQTKTIKSVVQDIYGLFKTNHTVSEENLEVFGNKCKELVRHSLATASSSRTPVVRMSNIGTPDRKLWYIMNIKEEDGSALKSSLEPKDLIKFLYGHLIEELLLLLVKETGHSVTNEQEEVVVNGIVGHRDCKIDGIPIDIKSASKYSFQKFSKGTLALNDSFGYIPQISGYCQAGGDKTGGFLALNKETGEICLLLIDEVDMIDVSKRADVVRDILSRPTPPEEKCYQPEPFGQSGNMVLNANCGYCQFKDLCWSDANNGKGLRKFQYSNKVEEFTSVVSTPKVPEIENIT